MTRLSPTSCRPRSRRPPTPSALAQADGPRRARRASSAPACGLAAAAGACTDVAQIVREELDAIGAQEVLMPVINPAEIWQRSGRYDIDELFKLQDRRGAELVLAMTHEEAVTTHVPRPCVLPRPAFSLYHFQNEGRDEPRPRAASSGPASSS